MSLTGNAHCESQIFMLVIQFNQFNAILQFIITLTTSYFYLLKPHFLTFGMSFLDLKLYAFTCDHIIFSQVVETREMRDL